MPVVTLDQWKRYIERHAEAHILQSAEWGELKAAFGWEAVRLVCEDSGLQVLFRRLPLGRSVAYLPKPVLHLDEMIRNDRLWGELVSLCKARHAALLKIEPDEWQSQDNPLTDGAGMPRAARPAMRPSSYNIQPPRTVVVDLRGAEDDILGRMKQKCRYNIRLAERKGVVVHPWDDLEAFHRLMHITGRRDGFAVHSADYYRRAYELFHPGGCELLVAEFDGTPLAALMVFQEGKRAWYLYGASNDEERNRMPAYLLQWRAMLWAKAHGCEEYDLWGVPDEDEAVLESGFETRQDGLWGVYRFKRGFGGQLRRAVQAVDVIFDPMLYKLYTWRMAGRETQ
ncbi:MAG TPA: peptidoglycan bridge formation glycyltransferase FemA/FemB family protein [Anaerolineales bacterium]|nr:peptidoglycan bridge formation glycyltransferase FemA/FemB family protein [Anaerolineales bacterium]